MPTERVLKLAEYPAMAAACNALATVLFNLPPEELSRLAHHVRVALALPTVANAIELFILEAANLRARLNAEADIAVKCQWHACPGYPLGVAHECPPVDGDWQTRGPEKR